MPESNTDDFPPYGPVPDPLRKPLRPPPPKETRPLARPMADLKPAGRPKPVADPKPAGQDARTLNRATEKSSKATAEENKALKYPEIDPLSERLKPPPFEELKQQIDEEKENRLNWMDGYTKPPPRPSEGFGLKLRPQHDEGDINEYFTGPKWYQDSHLETAESRGLTPWGPIESGDEVRYRDEGKTVRRPIPAKKDTPKPEPVPTPARPSPPIEITFEILFEIYTAWDAINDNPVKFANADALPKIQGIGKILQNDPKLHVEIQASVGLTSGAKMFGSSFPNKTMDKRGEAVSKQLQAMGIDPARIHIERGKVGTGAADRNVKFKIFEPER